MPDAEKPRNQKISTRPVGRRDLLKIGATSAVIPAVLGPATLPEKRKPGEPSAWRDLPAGPFSVGYWSGDPDSAMMSAKSLASGDSRFARSGARIDMIGMSPHSERSGDARLQSLAIDIKLEPVSYRAWRFDDSVVRNVSSPASFTVPVDARKGIVFTMQALAGGLRGAPRAGGFRLSPGKESSVAKLLPGYYVIAVGQHGRGMRVNWGSYALVGDSTGQAIGLYKNGKPATDFPYVVFSVAPGEKTGIGFV